MKPRADSRAARGIWAAVGGEKGAACVIVGGGAILGFFCFFGKGGGGGGVEVEKDGERGLSKKKKNVDDARCFFLAPGGFASASLERHACLEREGTVLCTCVS